MFHRRETTSICAPVLFSILMLLVVCGQVSAAEPLLEDVCADALQMSFGRAAQNDLDLFGNETVFFVSLPTAGFLSLEIPEDEFLQGSEVEILSSRCDPLNNDQFVLVQRSASSRWLAFSRPGDYYLRLTARGPEGLQGVRLRASFTAALVVENVHRLRPIRRTGEAVVRQTDFYPHPRFKNEWEEVDPDPNKSRRMSPVLTLLVARVASLAKNEWEEVDPDPNKSTRISTTSARLVLVPSAGVSTKNEWEEVDPDPNKSGSSRGRFIDGLLSVGDGFAGELRRGFVSFQLTEAALTSTPRYDALFEWLVAVLEVEIARSRLVAPGTGDRSFRLVDYQPGD